MARILPRFISAEQDEELRGAVETDVTNLVAYALDPKHALPVSATFQKRAAKRLKDNGIDATTKAEELVDLAVQAVAAGPHEKEGRGNALNMAFKDLKEQLNLEETAFTARANPFAQSLIVKIQCMKRDYEVIKNSGPNAIPCPN